ncbi:hypothetical protein N7470_008700 [Penicillium chermesinum]|nr:hypothetical protein N7470_008700 [Penicillium chermesinum]
MTDQPQPQSAHTPSHDPQPTQALPDVIRSFRPAKQFRGPKPESTYVTSLDFDDQGEFLVGAGDDDTVQIYDVKEGKSKKSVPSKKYGVHLARYTHHPRQVLHASTKVDHALRLLDLHNEGFVRYFTGHTDKVTCLTMSPGGDSFVSCSKDNTVTLWDVGSRNPQGKLNLSTPYLAAFDPSASVIAIASQSTSSVLLYDFRNYDKAPFATFDISPFEEFYTPSTRRCAWTRLEFSNDGKHLMIGHPDGFPSWKGRLTWPSCPVSTTGKPLGQGDATFTPDGRYVLGGNGSQPDVLVWDLQQNPDHNKVLLPMTKLSHRGMTALIEFNPRFNMLATADRDAFFWTPDDISKPSEK